MFIGGFVPKEETVIAILMMIAGILSLYALSVVSNYLGWALLIIGLCLLFLGALLLAILIIKLLLQSLREGGYCPSDAEVRSREVRNLAKQLKGKSEKETLVNVLDWQERNIRFWEARWPFVPAFIAFFGATIILLISNHSYPEFYPASIAWIATITGGGTVAVVIVILLSLHNMRILNLETLVNMVKPGISLPFFIKNKLGICRDYAKLTAALLLNLYPTSDICFSSKLGHVAAGIRVRNKIYILDQGLPIRTIEGWDRLWKMRKLERLTRNGLEKIKKRDVLTDETRQALDTSLLTKRLSKLLNINGGKTKSKSEVLPIRNFRKFKLYYEDDDIINYSFARLIKNIVGNEYLGNGKITKLDIKKQGKEGITIYCTVERV